MRSPCSPCSSSTRHPHSCTLILCVTLCYNNQFFYSLWMTTRDFVLRQDRLFRHLIDPDTHTHTSFASISVFPAFSRVFLFLILFFGPTFVVCMLSCSPLHMVTSSSLLPYTGRFYPHVLRLVAMSCVSLPFPMSYLPEQLHSSMVHECVPLLPYFIYGWSLLVVLLELHIYRASCPCHQMPMRIAYRVSD